MILTEQQRISLKGSDERIEYFTELLKSSKNASELSGAGVLLEATRIWKRSKHSLGPTGILHPAPQETRSASRVCYLFVFTPPADFNFLLNELNSLKTDKSIKRLLQGRRVGCSETLLESLILVLEFHLRRKKGLQEEDKRKRSCCEIRSPEPWVPVHDQAIKTMMDKNQSSLNCPPCPRPSSALNSAAPIMTLKERKIYAQELQTYLYTHPPEDALPPGFEGSDITNRKRLGIDCDEVFPRIILGNGATLKNITYLQRIGITHVLNAAEFRGVNLNGSYFEGSSICYKGLRVEDTPQTQICQHFSEVAKYIDEALGSSVNNKVYVNCLFGKSRSTTCILAYLMMIQGWPALKALTHIRKQRNVLINYGFLNQIADLDHRLKWEASQKGSSPGSSL